MADAELVGADDAVEGGVEGDGDDAAHGCCVVLGSSVSGRVVRASAWWMVMG